MDRNRFFLLTDFGTADPYVAQVKARILSLLPPDAPACFVDISNDVPRGDVAAAAWSLSNTLPHIPSSSVVVAVVDPGVGTGRRALACSSRSGVLLTGPDNGLFGWMDLDRVGILPASAPDGARRCDTFHGRDVFAEAAARLALEGTRFLDSLPPVDPVGGIVRFDRPEPCWNENGVECSVAAVDRFGNVVLWLPAGAAEDGRIPRGDGSIRLPSGRRVSYSPARTYSGGGERLLLVPGSQGYLELALDGGSAAERFGLRPGDRVVLGWPVEGSGSAR